MRAGHVQSTCRNARENKQKGESGSKADGDLGSKVRFFDSSSSITTARLVLILCLSSVRARRV